MLLLHCVLAFKLLSHNYYLWPQWPLLQELHRFALADINGTLYWPTDIKEQLQKQCTDAAVLVIHYLN